MMLKSEILRVTDNSGKLVLELDMFLFRPPGRSAMPREALKANGPSFRSTKPATLAGGQLAALKVAAPANLLGDRGVGSR
jgi:hypothetical protein